MASQAHVIWCVRFGAADSSALPAHRSRSIRGAASTSVPTSAARSISPTSPTHLALPFTATRCARRARSPAAQIGYNWQFGRGLVGLEADANWADLFGTETCFAYSGFYVSANCRADVDAVGTIAARFGWLVGPGASTLLYGKAGGAWSYSSVDATTNGDPGFPTTDTSRVHWGWMLGAGVERAISQRWSLKAEYDFLSFGNQGLSTPISDFQSVPLSRSQPDDSGGLDGDRLFAGHPSLQDRAQLPARRRAADDDR